MSESDIKKVTPPEYIEAESFEPVASEIKDFSGIPSTEEFSGNTSAELYNEDKPFFKRNYENFIDSFRRRPDDGSTLKGQVKDKSLSFRHVVLIALTTGVGTGLLVGSGKSLSKSGPAALLIGYGIIGTMVFTVIQSAAEMAVSYGDLSGGFNAYARKFVDESIGFAVGWNYCIQWITVISLELVTGSMTIKYWTDLPPDIFVTIFFVVLAMVHLFGAKGYGEAEFFLNSAKLLMITGFIILGIIVDVGGAGNPKEYIGAKYWHNPGAFNNGFKGVCTVFVTAAFAFGGTEFVALTVADTRNPRATMPSACKLVFWRIAFFFLTSLTIVGCLVPYNSDELLGSKGGATHASPFVIAIASRGIKAVPSIINAVILLSVLSVANSAMYSSCRVLQALAEQGFAPKFFDYIDKAGRPSRALGICIFFGLFAFVAESKQEETIFNWLLSISGLSTIFTWTTICISHLRFRAAMKIQGKDLSELGYVASTGEWGSYYAIILNCLVLIAQFWVSLWPVENGGAVSVNNFFQNYLGMFVLIAFYFGHKAYLYIKFRRFSLWIPADQIDLISHRTIFDPEVLALENLEVIEKAKQRPHWKKVLKFLFY